LILGLVSWNVISYGSKMLFTCYPEIGMNETASTLYTSYL